MNEGSKSKRSKILIIILIAVTLIAVGITLWALFLRDTEKPVNQDYAPQQIESNAVPDEDKDTTSKLEQPSGGGAVSLEYSKEVTLSLSDKTAVLMFKNPSMSNQDMVLQLCIDGKVIAESGRLPAGYKFEKLSGVDTEKLTAGAYEGKFTVLYYDAETGEKAMVNTEIPVTVTVTQ